MKATLDCLECFMKQALRAARIATDDEAVHRQLLEEAGAGLAGLDLRRSPAVLSQYIYERNASLSGKADPYLEMKRDQNALALGLEADLRAMVRASEDPLDTALHVAAAGNVIDLGTMHADDIDVHAALEQVMRDRFAVDHSDAFRESLARCGDLLYLLDNAGEIVFDKILIEELLRHTRVTAVVKAGPILNDALMEDAVAVGLAGVCPVIDCGGAYIGAPLELVPGWFLERMRAADVIVGKGQGNYETIDDFPGDVFLILRAKCEVVARHMGVRLGQVGLISPRVRAAAAKC